MDLLHDLTKQTHNEIFGSCRGTLEPAIGLRYIIIHNRRDKLTIIDVVHLIKGFIHETGGERRI